MNKYILVTAEKFGYGPIVTCLNVAKELKKLAEPENIKLIFLGTSIAKEQAANSSLFSEVIECKTYDYKELEKFEGLFRNALAIISSENQFGAIYAKKIGLTNVFFIDNLVWMWDKITPGLENVDGYFISETFDCSENFKRIGAEVKNPIFVGPLRKIDTKQYKAKKQLLINFGGAEAFMLEKDLVVGFYKKMLAEILIDKVNSSFDKIYVCGGSGLISELQNFNSEKTVVKSFPNKEFLKILHSSSHIIMSSGLGNFMETIGINKNIMFIPPVNYSQLLQIEQYKRLDLGLNLVNWNDFPLYKNVPDFVDEELGVNLVVKNVKNYLTYEKNIIGDKVNNFINHPQEPFFDKRKTYIEKFPKNSAKVVAKHILKSIKRT